MTISGVELGVQIIGSEIGVKNAFMSAIGYAEEWATATDAAGVKAARSMELTGLSAKQAAIAYSKLGIAAKAAASATADSTLEMQAAAVRYESTMAGLYAKQSAAGAMLAANQERAAMRYETALMGAGRTMTTYLTLPLAIAGYASIKMATDFQASMTRIQTYAGASAKEVKTMESVLLNSAGTLPQGPIKSSEALYHLESIGIRGPRALEALRAAAIAAGAGMADLTDSTTALGGALVAGVKGATDAKTAMAGLVAIAGMGNMTMQDLADAMGTGLLVKAHNVGLSMREVGSALAVLVDRGIPARRAATYLGTTFALMSAPSKAAQNALADMGVQATDMGKMMLQPNGLLNVLHLLAGGMARVGEARGAADLMSAFGRSRQSTGIVTLIESLNDKTSNYAQKLAQYDKGVADNAQRMALYQTTAQYKIHTALSQMQADFIKLGTGAMPYVADALKGVAVSVDDVVRAFNSMPAPMKEAFGIAVGALAIGGPILLGMGLVMRGVRSLGIAMVQLGGSAKEGAVAADASIASIGATSDAATVQVLGLKAALEGMTLTSMKAGEGFMVRGAGGRFVGSSGPVGLVTNEPYGAKGSGAYMVRNSITGKYMGNTTSVPPENLINPLAQTEQTGMMAGAMSTAKTGMSRLMPAAMYAFMGDLIGGTIQNAMPGAGGHTIGSTVKLAGLGAGIGTMIEPGGGTAIGAGVGALAGAVLGVIHSGPSFDQTMTQMSASIHQLDTASKNAALSVTSIHLQRMQLQDAWTQQARTVRADVRVADNMAPGTQAHAAAVRKLNEDTLQLRQTEQQLTVATHQLNVAEAQRNKIAATRRANIAHTVSQYETLANWTAMTHGALGAADAAKAYANTLYDMARTASPHLAGVYQRIAQIALEMNRLPTRKEIRIILTTEVSDHSSIPIGLGLTAALRNAARNAALAAGGGGGKGGSAVVPLTQAQQIQIALARNPSDRKALHEQIAADNRAIAHLQQQRESGKINNLQYTNAVTGYLQDRQQMQQQLKTGNNGSAAASAFNRRVTQDSLLTKARNDLQQGEWQAAQNLLHRDLARLEILKREAKTSSERYAVEKQIAAVERVMHEKAAGFQLPLALQAQMAQADALGALQGGTTEQMIALAKKAKAAAMKAINSHTLTLEGLIAAWQIVQQENSVIAGATNQANLYHKVSTDTLADSIKGLTAAQEMQLREKLAQRDAHRGYAPNNQGASSASVPASGGGRSIGASRRGGGDIVITGPINFHGVQNVHQLEAELSKLRSQKYTRAGSRR